MEREDSMKNVFVPDDRVNRVWSAVNPLRVTHEQVKQIVEAFAGDLADHPAVPSTAQLDQMATTLGHRYNWFPHIQDLIAVWQLRMFLVLEPTVSAVPEAVKHLTLQGSWDPMPSREVFNGRIVEAYNRGKALSPKTERCKHPLASRIVDDNKDTGHYEVCGHCMKTFK